MAIVTNGAKGTKLARRVRQEKTANTTVEQRPPSPYVGQDWRNPETGILEVFDGQEWILQEDETGLNAHINDFGNPHMVTKSQVGLSNVDNTSDADKPISTATQTALDGKANVDHTHDSVKIDETAGVPTTVVNVAQIYSDGADVYVKFGDGTIKTFTIT